MRREQSAGSSQATEVCSELWHYINSCEIWFCLRNYTKSRNSTHFSLLRGIKRSLYMLKQEDSRLWYLESAPWKQPNISLHWFSTFIPRCGSIPLIVHEHCPHCLGMLGVILWHHLDTWRWSLISSHGSFWGGKQIFEVFVWGGFISQVYTISPAHPIANCFQDPATDSNNFFNFRK